MRFPAFMFWPERYWLDTYDLSDAEHGRYLRVLILMWNTPNCRIPNDPEWIAAKTGRSLQAFENEIKPILLRFCKTDGNSWWQSKLLAEYQRCERLHNRGTAGGKALAKKKKESSQTHARDQKQAYAPTPTPTPTPTKEDSLFPDGNRDDGRAAVNPDDPRTKLFREGLQTLIRISGRTDSSCRSLIGSWLKFAAEDAIAVMGAIDDAARERPANPVPWIKRTLENRLGGSDGRFGRDSGAGIGPRQERGFSALAVGFNRRAGDEGR